LAPTSATRTPLLKGPQTPYRWAFSIIMQLRFLVVVMVALACTACAVRDGGDERTARRHNVITTEEIDAARSTLTMYELVRDLRPRWLQGRGVQSLGSPVPVGHDRMSTTNAPVGVVIYLDGTRLGGLEFLRQIMASGIREATFLGGTEAAARYGVDHSAGAILLTTRRPP
jgi:hypothetical protein